MQKNQLLKLTVLSIILLSSFACQAKNSVSNNDTTGNALNKPPADKSSATDKITLKITGGDMEGSYTASCDACCSYGIAGDNIFGTQYSEDGKSPKELSSVQLIVDSVSGSKSTQQFTVTVSFGKLFPADGESFNINTNEGNSKGSGTLNLEYSGDKAVVTIKGTSAEGPAIELKIVSDKVVTVDNIMK